jgi:Putative Flp pilus-assembly TadE/G-like
MRQRRSERGFNLIVTGISLSVLVGMLGLATDVGRIYIAKNELQAYADAAAVAAAYELDGTAQGVDAAKNVASAGPAGDTKPNRWDLSTKKVTGVQTAFAQTFAGTYDPSPGNPAGYRFVRVDLAGNVPLYFLPVVPGVGATQNVKARAIGGQALQNSLGNGGAPFSPVAHDPNDPNFGLQPGKLYTLRWAPKGKREDDTCDGEGALEPNDSNFRGYIDMGQGNGNSALEDQIVNGTYSRDEPLKIGDPLPVVSGQKSVTEEIGIRFSQDTDLSAPDFAHYNGNGRRLMVLPINDNGSPLRVAGFGAFFLPPETCPTGKNSSRCCAEYVGPALMGSNHQAAGDPGLYSVKLFQ